MLHDGDPAEPVSANQKQPRVGSGFKTDSNRNFKLELIQIFGNSYLLIHKPKINK
jgi:hypothetical protein